MTTRNLRHRKYLPGYTDRLGAANRYAIDPVCGMQVEKTAAPARASAGDASYWFCSDQCRDRIDSEPARVAGSVTS
jgi:uncharacterized protein